MGLRIGITCYPTVGGSGVVATELGKLLSERGHEIHFITSSMPFRLNATNHNVFYHQVEVNQYSVFQYPPYDIALASKMAEVAKREKLDILHVHYAIPHAVCAILGKQMARTGLKIVTTLHGTDITVLGYDPSLTEAIRFGIEQSDYVTAVSHALVEQTNELIAPHKDIDVVYNFIDERVYRPVDAGGLRKAFGISEDEKVLIHVSNFRPVKRVQDIVNAFSIISEKVKAKLLLVGDGPEKTIVCRQIKRLGLEDKVLLLGRQDHVEELYSASDLMLLLSEKESFGLVALEAAACGVPCLGTDVGGIPEVIEDGFNGYICELGNIEEVAEKAVSLLKDEKALKDMSENATTIAKHRFHSTAIVSQYEKIYESLIAEKREG